MPILGVLENVLRDAFRMQGPERKFQSYSQRSRSQQHSPESFSEESFETEMEATLLWKRMKEKIFKEQ